VPVIVGIVDSGVDIEHEDLKSVLWTNAKELRVTELMMTKRLY
jgi:hypothetical protein